MAPNASPLVGLVPELQAKRQHSCSKVNDDDRASIQRSIRDMRCVQDEQTSLLQDLLQQGPNNLKAVEALVEDVRVQSRLALSETQALLKPMQQCLQIMQIQLQELPRPPVIEEQGSDPNFVVDIDSYDPNSAMGANNVDSGHFAPDAEDKLSDQPKSFLTDRTDQRESSPEQNLSQNKLEREDAVAALDLLEQRKIKRMLRFGAVEGAQLSIEDKVVQKIEACFQVWSSIEVPQYNSYVYKLVNSNIFSSVCMIAICLNSVLVAAIADWRIQHIDKDAPQFLENLEMSFTFFFLAELILRLGAFRMYFFLHDDMLWNIFDFLLVSISVVDFIFKHFVGSQAGSNVSFMRLVRLLKMARIFRSLRTIQFFKALSIMLSSLKKAFLSLFWGMVLLCFVLYLFALIYLQAFLDYFDSAQGEDVDADILLLMNTRFDSLLSALISLYMSVTGGEDWGFYYDTTSKIGPIYGFLFLLYTFFFFFGLLNILTGLVVEKAMAEGEPDRGDQILHQRRALAQNRHELTQICKSIDVDNSGRISYEEFNKWISHSVMKQLMQNLGLDVKDVELFFDAIAAKHGDCAGLNHGEVTIDKFVEGCLHMKGSATAIDMQKQLYEMGILLRTFRQFETSVSKRLSRIEKVMAHSQQPLSKTCTDV